MEWKPISKNPDALKVRPHLIDYERTCSEFSWEAARRELDGLPGGKGLNISHEAVDRHMGGRNQDRLAMRWIGRDGSVRDFSFGDLAMQSSRFANLLASLGVTRGERVFALCGRIPELYFTALGTLKNVSVFCPLFSAFGPEPIRQRLERGDARVLVTTARQYEKKVAALLERLPQLKHVLLTDAAEDLNEKVLSLPRLMAAASTQFAIPPTSPEDMAILHFTSGTTGMPKGAVHVHNAVLTHFITGRYVLDFHPDDVFWCTADPGWVTGTSYGIIAPLLHGVTSIIDEADFDAGRWYRLLEEQRVTV